MLSKHIVINPESQNLLLTICKLAKERNEQALRKMADQGIGLNAIYGIYTPIMLLAEQNDVYSVEFLMSKFQISSYYAVWGYALGGNVDEVNMMLAQGASIHQAVQGYAAAGNVSEVNKLLARGANIDSAIQFYAFSHRIKETEELIARDAPSEEVKKVRKQAALLGYALNGCFQQVDELLSQGVEPNSAAFGYAMGGFVDKVNVLLERGADINYAAMGYAFSGNIDQVNNLITRDAKVDTIAFALATAGYVKEVNNLIERGANPDFAVKGYAHAFNTCEVNCLITKGARLDKAVEGFVVGKHLNDRNILRLLSLIKNEDLRTLIINKAKEENINLNIEALQSQAIRTEKIMHAYKLDYAQARSLTIPHAREWLLQGHQLIKSRRIIEEIYWNISSFLLGLSQYNSKIVFQAVHEKWFQGIVSNFNSNITMFPSKEKRIEKMKEIKSQYERRKSMV
jgi:hypothetical protein